MDLRACAALGILFFSKEQEAHHWLHEVDFCLTTVDEVVIREESESIADTSGEDVWVYLRCSFQDLIRVSDVSICGV